MAAQYPPDRDRELQSSIQVFLEQIAPLKETLALPDDFEARLADLHTTYTEQLDRVAQMRAHYREAVQQKEATQRALKEEVRRLVRVLRAHPEFEDSMARALGLPVRDRKPTPIEPQDDAPLLEVEVRQEQHALYFWHAGSGRGRWGKPSWARAARIVYGIVAPRAPLPPMEQMQYLVSATRSPYVWTPPSDAIGQIVWYRAAWETPRGALGPWSDYARAIVG